MPPGGYDTWSLAADIHCLLHDELGLTGPAFVVGHDIGAMVAVAYALRYRPDVRTLCFGEAPLPGTEAYEQMKNGPAMFHFAFHSILDLPEALTAGRERIYPEVAAQVRVQAVAGSGHWAAEENPSAMVEILIGFDRDTRTA